MFTGKSIFFWMCFSQISSISENFNADFWSVWFPLLYNCLKLDFVWFLLLFCYLTWLAIWKKFVCDIDKMTTSKLCDMRSPYRLAIFKKFVKSGEYLFEKFLAMSNPYLLTIVFEDYRPELDYDDNSFTIVNSHYLSQITRFFSRCWEKIGEFW